VIEKDEARRALLRPWMLGTDPRQNLASRVNVDRRCQAQGRRLPRSHARIL